MEPDDCNLLLEKRSTGWRLKGGKIALYGGAKNIERKWGNWKGEGSLVVGRGIGREKNRRKHGLRRNQILQPQGLRDHTHSGKSIYTTYVVGKERSRFCIGELGVLIKTDLRGVRELGMGPIPGKARGGLLNPTWQIQRTKHGPFKC